MNVYLPITILFLSGLVISVLVTLNTLGIFKRNQEGNDETNEY